MLFSFSESFHVTFIILLKWSCNQIFLGIITKSIAKYYHPLYSLHLVGWFICGSLISIKSCNIFSFLECGVEKISARLYNVRVRVEGCSGITNNESKSFVIEKCIYMLHEDSKDLNFMGEILDFWCYWVLPENGQREKYVRTINASSHRHHLDYIVHIHVDSEIISQREQSLELSESLEEGETETREYYNIWHRADIFHMLGRERTHNFYIQTCQNGLSNHLHHTSPSRSASPHIFLRYADISIRRTSLKLDNLVSRSA